MTALSENRSAASQPLAEPLEACALADPRLLRLILRLSGPAILGISAHSLQMAANAAFVAPLGSAAVAAVVLTQSMTLAISALGYGLGVGAASLISRALGRGDVKTASRAAATALTMIAPASALALAVFLTDIDGALTLFGAGPTVVATAHAYAALSVVGTTVMLVHIVGGFIARAEASARFSMATMVGSFGLNIFLDAVFISGLGWGLDGAGWATLIGQLAAAAAYVYYFAGGVSHLRPRFTLRRASLIARDIIAIGLPATATALLSALSLIALFKCAASQGDAAVAAIGVALRMVGVGMLPVLGLCAGAEAVFGFAHGAGDRARLRRAINIVLAIAGGYALVWAGGVIAFAPQALAPFSPDVATLELTIRASNVFEAALVLSAVSFVLLTLFQAIGEPRRALILSFASQGYALLPLLALLPPRWGFDGVIASRALAEAIACTISVALLLSYRRRVGQALA